MASRRKLQKSKHLHSMNKKEREANVNQLNSWGSVNLLVTRAMNDVNGNPMFEVTPIFERGQMIHNAKILKGVLHGRVTEKSVKFQAYTSQVIDLVLSQLQEAGVIVPINVFKA